MNSDNLFVANNTPDTTIGLHTHPWTTIYLGADIVISKRGFSYKDTMIEDGGKCYRLLMEFLTNNKTGGVA